MKKYKICISKNFLNFSSGHFVVFGDSQSELLHPCESLHGHNYRVGVEMVGPIDEKTGFMVDFGIVKNLLKEILSHLDHLILVPTDNPLINVEKQNEQVSIKFGEKTYILPLSGVVLLPIPNATAEMLAKYILDKLIEELRKIKIDNLELIEVEVEENFGQSAKCSVEINIK